MRDVLVTGGNGFIGRWVVEELRDRGYHPVIFDRKASSLDMDDSVFGDIKDDTLVDDAVSHVDGVIHLAGILGTQETVADPRHAAATNVLGGLNVVVACGKYDVPLINIGVGNYWMHNTYSITKNSVERFVKMKRLYEGKVMATVRALNAYGPGQVPVAPWGPSRVRKIMPSFICRALTEEPIEVYGDGTQVMDMVYVQDVAFTLVRALEHISRNHLPERTIQVGTGRHTTVLDIAQSVQREVLEKTGIKANIEHLPMRPGEPPQSVVVANPDTLSQINVDVERFVTLDDGVAETVSYYRGYLGSR